MGWSWLSCLGGSLADSECSAAGASGEGGDSGLVLWGPEMRLALAKTCVESFTSAKEQNGLFTMAGEIRSFAGDMRVLVRHTRAVRLW